MRRLRPIVACSVAGLALAAPAAATPPTRPPVPTAAAGQAAVVSASNANQTLTEGGSTTVFTLRLPDDATCPGDSANDQWRVQSFVVPAGVNPATLAYDDIGPSGEHQFGLYDVDQWPYVDVLLQQNDAPDQPGRISPVPPLSFAVLPPGSLPPGDYRIGLACTYFERATARYWETTIAVDVDPGDAPGRLHWRVVDPAPTFSSGSGRPLSRWITGAVAVGALGALAASILRRRRHEQHVPSTVSEEHT